MRAPLAVALVTALGGLSGCSKPKGASVDAGAAPSPVTSTVSVSSATVPGAPTPGMQWIPTGILKAGTPADRVPRISGEELPWTDAPLAGFYVDDLPWPNEAGAIPTTNVTRDEASRLCASKGKRLCTELEWERACKGPDNTIYEYGDDYRPQPCGTGGTAEEGARRPSGDRLSCKSGFGVRDMHGGVWEWTDSPWGRGHTRELGVLRGGNAVVGELVGRCANARALAPSTKSPTVGFRCCKGPRNDAQVDLKVTMGEPLRKAERLEEVPAAVALGCGAPQRGGSCFLQGAWTWRPAANVELYVKGGCTAEGRTRSCGVIVGRAAGEKVEALASVPSGREPPEVVLMAGEQRSIRMKGGDDAGPFFREIAYVYGRLEVREVKAK